MNTNSLGQTFSEWMLHQQVIADWMEVLLEHRVQVRADRVLIRPSVLDRCQATFQRNRESKGILSDCGFSMEVLSRWLDERVLPGLFFGSVGRSAVRVKDEIHSFRVVRSDRLNGGYTLALSEVQVTPLAELLQKTGFSAKHLQRIFDAEKPGRVIAVCARSYDELTLVRGILLCVTGGMCLEGEEFGEMDLTHDQLTPLFIPCTASDGFSCFQDLRQRKGVQAILYTRPLQRVCEHCGREAAITEDMLDELPQLVRDEVGRHFWVGRGCDTCGHSGVSGTICVSEFFQIPKDRSPSSREEFATAGEKEGFSPIAAQALAQLRAGTISFGSFQKVSGNIPSAYYRFFANQVIPLNDDAITPSSPEKVEKQGPLRPRILVVEDDHDQRDIIEMVLQSSNYEVTTAGNGKEGLAAIQDQRPDLILCDLMMPEMDGTQMIRELKGSSHLRSIPVLVLTVVSDEEKEFTLLEMGADDYCEKTIQRKVLLKRIEKLLQRNVRM